MHFNVLIMNVDKISTKYGMVNMITQNFDYQTWSRFLDDRRRKTARNLRQDGVMC
jgi:hypothetical protein